MLEKKIMHSILSHYGFPCMKIKVKKYRVKCLSYSIFSGNMEGKMQIFEKETPN